MSTAAQLQQQAIEHARAGRFGPEARETNLELTRLTPDNEGAWTRLGRCYLEGGQLDDATAALDVVMRLNPQNMIARSLQVEVTKRRVAATAAVNPAVKAPKARAARPKRAEGSGARVGAFGPPEFAALGQLAPDAAVQVLGPRVESLLMALNKRPFAAEIVEARNQAGRSGAWLYRRNSFYSGSAGHIDAFQYGGRSEPQLNVAITAATHSMGARDSVRAGIGFNLTQDELDPKGEAGQERVLAYFGHFQQLVSSEWRGFLTEWLAGHGGFIQYGHNPPATNLPPDEAIAFLINCEHPADTGWVFCGRWLFADRPEDADILADARRLVSWIGQTFDDLLPLWKSLYRAKPIRTGLAE